MSTIQRIAPRLTSWKADEYSYCARLIRSRGDANVGWPLPAIDSYLMLQAQSALRDQEWEISSRLACAADYLRKIAAGEQRVRWEDVEALLPLD